MRLINVFVVCVFSLTRLGTRRSSAFVQPPSPAPLFPTDIRRTTNANRCEPRTKVDCSREFFKSDWYNDAISCESPSTDTTEMIRDSGGNERRSRSGNISFVLRSAVGSGPWLLFALTAGAQSACAAVTGGRIGGSYSNPHRTPSAPPQQQQQQQQRPTQQKTHRSPQAGRDIYGSAGSRVYITRSGDGILGGGGRRAHGRLDPDVGDVVASTITAADVIMVGGVGAGVAAMQRRARNKFLQDEAERINGQAGETDGWDAVPVGAARTKKETTVVTTLQIGLYCDRRGGLGDVLANLESLSQSADVRTAHGLSSLVNEVCLTMLRAEKDWIGVTGGLKDYTKQGGRASSVSKRATNGPRARAKRDFNRAVTRERAKWERETVSTTPDRGYSSNRSPEWRGPDEPTSGTYIVTTMIVAWDDLRSQPPETESRKGGWFRRGDASDDERGLSFSVTNRKRAMAFLEWLGDEAAEGQGGNILDLEILWSPADADDSLNRDDVDMKWPELRAV